MKTTTEKLDFYLQPLIAVPIFLGTTVFVFTSISRLVSNEFHGFDTSDWIKNILLLLVFSTYSIIYFRRKTHKSEK